MSWKIKQLRRSLDKFYHGLPSWWMSWGQTMSCSWEGASNDFSFVASVSPSLRLPPACRQFFLRLPSFFCIIWVFSDAPTDFILVFFLLAFIFMVQKLFYLGAFPHSEGVCFSASYTGRTRREGRKQRKRGGVFEGRKFHFICGFVSTPFRIRCWSSRHLLRWFWMVVFLDQFHLGSPQVSPLFRVKVSRPRIVLILRQLFQWCFSASVTLKFVLSVFAMAPNSTVSPSSAHLQRKRKYLSDDGDFSDVSFHGSGTPEPHKKTFLNASNKQGIILGTIYVPLGCESEWERKNSKHVCGFHFHIFYSLNSSSPKESSECSHFVHSRLKEQTPFLPLIYATTLALLVGGFKSAFLGSASCFPFSGNP